MERFENAIRTKESKIVKYHPTYRSIDELNIVGRVDDKIEYDVVYRDILNTTNYERKYFKMEDVWLYE